MSKFYYEPEPRIDPPEYDEVFADCGHNVYKGEKLYEVEDKWLCPDCFEDKTKEFSVDELAELLGVAIKVIT